MDLQLQTPGAFSAFPYQPPYPIQVDLMRHLYTSIEQKAVTIVESPTGTGKTLTLLCASLTWLMDEKNRARKGKMKAVAGGDGVDAKDWVMEQTLARVRREMEADEREYEENLARARKREEQLRRMANGRMSKRAKYADSSNHESGGSSRKKKTVVDEDNDDAFLPEDDTVDDGGEHISPELRALMEKVERVQRSRHLNDDEEEIPCTKIYYASRTHSQLTQVLPELGKLNIKNSVSITNHHPTKTLPSKRPAGDDEDEEAVTTKQFRAVSLGSRKQLCINDELKAKSRDLDEACRELLGEKAGKRCQYLPPPGEEVAMIDFRDQILASPKDIEDLAEAGRLSNICPYFGSRKAISQAELVTLPYNLLLQKSAREALGINLKDQIIVIDEAHNLIPTLLSLSTTKLPFSALSTSLQQVAAYVQKFRTRLSAANMLHLKRLGVFLDALKKAVLHWRTERLAALAAPVGKSQRPDKAEVMTLVEFMGKLGKKASSINLLEVEGYLKKSKIARKIAGYSDKQAEKDVDPKSATHKSKRGTLPPLHSVEDFMLSLSNSNDDGRVTFTLVESAGQEPTVELKYQLLNPAPNFMEVVEEARSVVLAGGTMSPVSDVINQLIQTFSCGHVIPEENLQTMVVTRGPKGGDLDFKAGRWQSDPTVIAELGQILYNYTCVVPAGMVVFVPSYSFLNTAKDIWTKNKTLDRFGSKKTVFFEPQESVDVDIVLRDYAKAAQETSVDKKGGALLFAVIGAKLSEGLNFADDLARAVVIVGLPFPNLGSPELRERMKYVKMLEEKASDGKDRFTKTNGKKDAAAELYENMCMNAVNQSIGRAIRHRNDWATLLLLDRRYATSSIRSKLPKWIGSKLTVNEVFGQTIKELAAFSARRKQVPPLS
ncbi:helicase C-terminal domain-containing protein [Ephemerocybe angulata]|uniref:ATP-dependent DNA helicase CHL1 n=1 Tax=Ephemerocybe angulata TaxID=980116 RepID=A0A8H6MAZ3_9AGAR|nr:helicase C-terminal domain-containing protein [Tulosesus angulatus]